ncbi:MAG: helix-turn-helix transcriptional regulator [Pygmaiobacter sp.]
MTKKYDLAAVGLRIRAQRITLGYTRESLAEQLSVTPKFCSDIELGQKGMSVQTLCRMSRVLFLSTDYILFGTSHTQDISLLDDMLQQCPAEKLPFATEILRTFLRSL